MESTDLPANTTIPLLKPEGGALSPSPIPSTDFGSILFDRSDCAILIVDSAGKITRVNPACLRITGFAEEDLVGQNYLEVMVPPDLLEESQQKLVTMLETFEPQHCEKRWLRKDGTCCILKGTFSVVLTPEREIDYIIGIGINVSEERAAQDALQKTQMRFELAVDGTEDGIWDRNATTGETYFSPRWKQLLGYEDDEFENSVDAWLSHIHPDDRPRVDAYVSEYVYAPKPRHVIDYRMRHRDGTWRWIHSQGKAIYGDNGEIVRVAGSNRDITNQKVAELALRESEMRLREAQDIARLGTWELDLATDQVWWSPQTYFIYGLDPDQAPLSMEKLLETVHPDDRATVRESIKHTLKTGDPYRVKRRIYRPSGELRHIVTSARILVDENGTRSRVVGVVQDVTDQQNVEDTIVKAREQALEASRLKSEFLANMSHEIRTPMNGVIGMAEMLLESKLDQEQQKVAYTIKASADGLMTILNDILDFSKIEAGKLSLEEAEVDILAVVEDVATILSRSCQEKGLTLKIDADYSKSCTYLGDPTRIRQILLNLASNAVKFTSSGEVTMGISPSLEGVQLWVQDTGLGIAIDRHRAIFDSFTQADGSTTRQFGGTGLGLAIVRQLVDLMVGSVALISTPGKGSRFDVFLPLEKRESAANSSLYAGLTMVFVSESPETGQTVSQFFGKLGVKTIVVTSSDEVSSLMQDGNVEIVLVDEQTTPRQDWGTLVSLQADSDVRLILLSSVSTSTPSGFTGTLTRPLTRNEIYHAIDSTSNVKKQVTAHEEAQYSGRRLLLAEDNIINQQVAEFQAARLGFQIDVANNGREAVEMALNNPYDVILMDIQMPEMDGLMATAQIRRKENPEHRAIIIAMTAHAMQGDRERCLDAGMDDYISKPVRTQELVDKLKTWLGNDDQTVSKINWNLLHEISDNDQDFEREIISIYVHMMPAIVNQLIQAIQLRNHVTANRLAHTLKGSSRSIGANQFGDICDEIEQLSSANQPISNIERLRQQFDELIADCEKFLNTFTDN